MSSSSFFQASKSAYLVNGVAGLSAGLVTQPAHCRRYRSVLTIGVYQHGCYNYDRKAIMYEIARRPESVTKMLAHGRDNEKIMEIDASVRINEMEAANFEGWARRYSNFAAQWTHMDLCALVERLAKGIAAQSIYGDVSTKVLRAGHPANIVALGAIDAPVTASSSSVFLPRLLDTVEANDIFAVLAAAANGEGAVVVTDALRLDANHGQPIAPEVSGNTFAKAAVEALRILGANFDSANAGDLFSYALTRGIHQVVSVVGHTDEGGWFRDVLRSSSFRVPYGGVNPNLNNYPYLPPLAGQAPNAVSAWVDSIALKTAALVAHCDPCVQTASGLFPTIYTSSGGDGQSDPAGDGGLDDSKVIGSLIAADIGRFSAIYCRGLSKLFGLSGHSGLAEQHLNTCCSMALTVSTDHHLSYKTVAPYFWIEPTSVIPADFLGSPAETAGFASLVTVGDENTIPTFETCKEIDKGRHSDFVALAFKMRTARTSGLVAAYASTPAKLAGMRLYQYDETSIALPGRGQPQAMTLGALHKSAAPLSAYLWKRGQSPIPAPAELINIQSVYGAKYKLAHWSSDYELTVTDMPEVWELEQHKTTWRVTTPTAMANGKANIEPRSVSRMRTEAAVQLAQTALRNRALGEASSPVMYVSNVPPTLDGSDIPPAGPDLLAHDPHKGASVSLAQAGPETRDSEEVVLGARLHPTVMHGAQTGPRVETTPSNVRPVKQSTVKTSTESGNAPPDALASATPTPQL